MRKRARSNEHLIRMSFQQLDVSRRLPRPRPLPPPPRDPGSGSGQGDQENVETGFSKQCRGRAPGEARRRRENLGVLGAP